MIRPRELRSRLLMTPRGMRRLPIVLLLHLLVWVYQSQENNYNYSNHDFRFLKKSSPVIPMESCTLAIYDGLTMDNRINSSWESWGPWNVWTTMTITFISTRHRRRQQQLGCNNNNNKRHFNDFSLFISRGGRSIGIDGCRKKMF